MPTSVQIIVLGLLAVVGIISLILEIKARRPKASPVDKPANAIELPPPEKPSLVTVTPPVKITSNEALTAANRNRSATARVRAENAAWDLQTGRSREETAKDAGYKSVDSMRKCMAKYGFKMPKLPKKEKG